MDEYMTLTGAMGSVVVAWSALVLVLIGLGLLLRRAVGLRAEVASDRFADFWIGWAVLVAMLQLWHLCLPVDGRALADAALLAVGGWWWSLRDLRLGAPSWGLWLVVLVVAVLLSDQAIGP